MCSYSNIILRAEFPFVAREDINSDTFCHPDFITLVSSAVFYIRNFYVITQEFIRFLLVVWGSVGVFIWWVILKQSIRIQHDEFCTFDSGISVSCLHHKSTHKILLLIANTYRYGAKPVGAFIFMKHTKSSYEDLEGPSSEAFSSYYSNSLLWGLFCQCGK